MSYMGSKNHYPTSVMRAIYQPLEEKGYLELAEAIIDCMKGVNRSEDKIRISCERLQREAEEALSRLEAGGTIYSGNAALAAAHELQQAVRERELYSDLLLGLLGHNEIEKPVPLEKPLPPNAPVVKQQ